MRAKSFVLLLAFSLLARMEAHASRDTASIYFPFNQSTLTEAARLQLDKVIYNGTISDKQPVQIIGYADEVGGNEYNLRLSKQRAASVKTYLIQSGFSVGRMTLVMGKGEAGAHPAAGPDGNAADRRVDIVKGTGPVAESAKPIAGPKPLKSALRKVSGTDISTVAAGEALILDKIYFYPGRHVVRRESDEALDALYQSLEEHPKVRISIEGHVCCVSSADAIDDDTHQMNLSVNRARAIRDYLVEHGIAAERLEFAGFGRSRPVIIHETTEEEADKNRRVEVRVIK